MSISVKTARSESKAATLADLALKHRLYVSGWQLSGVLKEIRENPEGSCLGISIVIKDGVPVSVATLPTTTDSNIINCFTRKKLRKSGYGRMAVGALLDMGLTFTGHDFGIDGCEKFYQKCGLEIS